MDIHCPFCKCNQEVSDALIARHLASKGGSNVTRKKQKSFSDNFSKRWANHKKKQ